MYRVVIVDSCLTDTRGHHLDVTTTLSDYVLKTGGEVTWYTHSSFAAGLAPAGVRLRPHFSTSSYELLAAGHHQQDLSPAYESAFHAILSDQADHTTRVVCHTADAHVYRAIARLSASPERRSMHAGATSFHISTPYEAHWMPGAQAAPAIHEILDLLAMRRMPDRNFYFWAETTPLAAYFREVHGMDVDPLPLPTPAWIDANAQPIQSGNALQVVYLGAAREDKGFCILPELAAAVAADQSLSARVQFTIQAYPPQRGYRPALRTALEKLRQLPNVSLIENNLPAADYHRLVHSSDVVLLLYDSEKYCRRGSAIAVEALSAGKHLLASRGLFVEQLAVQNLISYGSHVRGWLEGLRVLADCVSELRRDGVQKSAEFRREHMPSRFFSRIEAREAHTADH